ncbi:reverse transcriptase-rnase h-integrase [Moniliophthora roreri MCA 2997]|uniref:Reverse transcriptase-rnase h-integrase n=1 Tax=Moniliophthora roreri (strain MCA 2997) TaxID=1381753 RepID=V2WRU9_MONRO|nr:reverse transcriptase-rnase h-integrase [Moniliophthora roreri MCA 2997]
MPGTSMTQADALSRRNHKGREEDNDNDDIILLPERLFVKGINLDLGAEIADRLGLDDFYKSALEQLLQQGMPPIKSALSDWEICDGLLLFKDRIYILNDLDLQQRVVQSIHETLGVGHPGQWNTLEQVQRDFWWLGMAKFVKSFVDGCVPCQQSKVNMHPTKTPIQPLQHTLNSLSFQTCTMDLITDLPECDGMDSILVVVDHSSTKGVIFTPCTKKSDAMEIADLLIQHVYKSVVNQLGRRTDGNGYPHPDINDTRSLLARLTSKPQALADQLSPRVAAAPCPTTEPPASNTLIYPDPTPDPDVKPKIEPTDHSPARDLKPLTTADPRSLQTPEASVPP